MLHVIIVDDDVSIVNILKDVVSQHFENMSIGVASSGLEAIERIKLEQPDILLLDYLLPDCDGLQVIRQTSSACQPSIIMISEVSDKEMIARAYNQKISFFISKPINVVEVVAVLNQIMEHHMVRKTLNQFELAIKGLNNKHIQKIDDTENSDKKLKKIYSRLGIIGVSGCEDLIKAVLWAKKQSADYSLSEMYLALIDQSDKMSSNEQQIYAVKKRINRVITKAFRVLASIGLEDQYNPMFEDYSSQLFDYSELRLEMKLLDGTSTKPGKINIKQFIESSIVLMENQE